MANSPKGNIQAHALPLQEMQRALEQSDKDFLSGGPETILRRLPTGYGGVVRLSREPPTDILAIRNAFRNAAARLRLENSERGHLTTAAREEGGQVAIYFWYTGEAAQPTREYPQQPASASAEAPLGTGQAQHPQAIATAPGQLAAAFDQEWTLPAASATLGVSVKTIRRAIKAGRVPARLVAGPRGPEYRVDIRPMQENPKGIIGVFAPPVTSAAPLPGASVPHTSVGQSHTAPALGRGLSSPEAILHQLLSRLDSLEAEVIKLRRDK